LLESEVPNGVATLHNTARHGRHRADSNCLAWGKDSETQIKPFYAFERRRELDGGAVGRGVLLQHDVRLSAIRRESDDTIVTFGAAGPRSVQGWAHNRTDAKIREISMRSESKSLEFKVPMIRPAPGCVSRRRDGR
jgi:hypothetical protein